MADDLPMSMRTAKGESDYQHAKTVGGLKLLSEEPSVREFEHWRIIENRFPYDSVLQTHHLLLPKRVVSDRFWLEANEVMELDEILTRLNEEGSYDFFTENFNKRRSIAIHYHLHLGKYYDKRSDMPK